MDIEEMLEIHDCPLCDGGSLLEEESVEAAKKTVMLWNAGKVISSHPGE